MKPTYDHKGWYRVTLYQYSKGSIDDPDYFQEWVEYKNGQWDYEGYSESCYVCFIHFKED